MYLIQDSKDLLYVIIALCVFILTIFFAWLVYYLAMITRQFYKTVKEMRERFKKADEVLSKLKEKIEHSASYLSLIGEGIKKLVEIAKEYSEGKKKKRK